jgi:cytochrome c-type biogenesis protein
LKKGRKLGASIQRVSGVLIILLGIFDSLTYWSL